MQEVYSGYCNLVYIDEIKSQSYSKDKGKFLVKINDLRNNRNYDNLRMILGMNFLTIYIDTSRTPPGFTSMCM